MGNEAKIFEVLDELRERVTRIETKLDTTPKCPDPGACVRVEKALFDHNRRLTILELAQSQRLGERTAIAAVCTAVGIGVGWAIELFRGNH